MMAISEFIQCPAEKAADGTFDRCQALSERQSKERRERGNLLHAKSGDKKTGL